MHKNYLLTLMIGISIFGSFTTLMLAFYSPITPDNFWRKPLIGSIFTLICIFGVLAVFFSEKCSKFFYMHKTEKPMKLKAKNLDSHGFSFKFKGHHIDCGRFSTHVICINNHIICAACAGLLLGALITLVGNFFYFFVGFDIGQLGLPIILVGQIGILLGMIQFKFKGYLRLIVNTFFVISSFLVLVGMDTLSKSAFIDLYTLLLIIFWLLTRILISQWDHWRICYTCNLHCKMK